MKDRWAELSPVQYGPRRQSRQDLADYDGKKIVEKVSFEPGMTA